jgi:hypothetical protein
VHIYWRYFAFQAEDVSAQPARSALECGFFRRRLNRYSTDDFDEEKNKRLGKRSVDGACDLISSCTFMVTGNGNGNDFGNA